MKLFIKYSLGITLILTLIWIINNSLEKPNLRDIEKNNPYNLSRSKTPNRNTYSDLIKEDSINNRTFLLQANHSCLFNNEFPYSYKIIDQLTTSKILTILRDSNSYLWGDFGTPYIDQTIVFYNKKGLPIGYTEIDLGGGIYSFPYRYLMKGSTLTPRNKARLLMYL